MNPQERRARITGALLIAVGAIAFSGKAVIIKLAFRHGVDAVTLLAFRMLFSAPLFLMLGWWASRGKEVAPLSCADRRAVLALGLVGYYLMAAVSTVLPIVFTSEGIRRIGASHASIIGAVGPIATIFLGAIFLGEQVTAIQLLGALLVLAGVLAVSLQRTAVKP